LAPAFLAPAFLAVDLRAVDFLAVVFRAVVLRAVERFFAAPVARLAALRAVVFLALDAFLAAGAAFFAAGLMSAVSPFAQYLFVGDVAAAAAWVSGANARVNCSRST
jgi:hypothetical protein